MTQTFNFTFSGDAYDATQCDENIKNGDTLVIAEEGVVGLAWTWPIAITIEPGKLHQAKEGLLLKMLTEDVGASLEAIKQAITVARANNWPIEPELENL